jgi:hypothetical protein
MAVAVLPEPASAFLATLDALTRALRDPESPGGTYLRTRGLDPGRAADLGAGYAATMAWPGDSARRVGRLVYPLADPATGRLVSAVGRLCVDPDPTWPDAWRAAFKAAKQRKLAGCPSGIWPYASLRAARTHRRPLVLVEGPADVVALMQRAPRDLDVVALIGTVNVLSTAALQGVPGVVLALDDDGGGAKGTRALWTALALGGVLVEPVPVGWLGGATDPADLAAAVARAPEETDDEGAMTQDGRYRRAVDAVLATCDRLLARARVTGAQALQDRGVGGDA